MKIHLNLHSDPMDQQPRDRLLWNRKYRLHEAIYFLPKSSKFRETTWFSLISLLTQGSCPVCRNQCKVEPLALTVLDFRLSGTSEMYKLIASPVLPLMGLLKPKETVQFSKTSRYKIEILQAVGKRRVLGAGICVEEFCGRSELWLWSTVTQREAGWWMWPKPC